MEATGLRHLMDLFIQPSILDVRDEEQFREGHLPGAIHAPDGNTKGLMEKIMRAKQVVLVCDTGKLSSTVARMLGVCGFPEVTYLQGGLAAWKAIEAPLMETTRRGEERRVIEGGAPDGPGPIGRLLGRLTPPVLYAGLAGAAMLLGSLALLINR